MRGEELGFGGFPGDGQRPIHSAASLGTIPAGRTSLAGRRPFA
jgi:hypothetical protein